MGQLRIWADNAAYGPGHPAVTGTPTKIDPGATSVADGIVPGEAMPSQHLNHQLYEHSRSAIVARAGALRSFVPVGGQTFTSSSQTFRAVYIDHLGLTGFCLGGKFYTVPAAGAIAANPGNSTVDNVNGALLYNAAAQRLVIIGSGADNAAYSDNDGVTWTAATTPPAVACTRAISPKFAVILATPDVGAASTAVQRSLDGGDTYAAVAVGGNALARGIGRCGPDNNAVAVLDASNQVYTADDRDDYTAWTLRGPVPDAGNISNLASLDSDASGTAYFAAEYGNDVRVYALDAPSQPWRLAVSLDGAGGTGAAVQLMLDQRAGAMHALVLRSANHTTVYTSLDGAESWHRVDVLGGAYFAAGGGSLWHRPEDGLVWRTAGVGVD